MFEMKFMKDVMAKDKLRADQVADGFIRELGGRIPGEDEDGDQDGPRRSAWADVCLSGQVTWYVVMFKLPYTA